MTEVQPGDRVTVSEEARTAVTSDHIDAVAGKIGHVIDISETEFGLEAFVVAHPLDKNGPTIPLNYLTPVE